MNTDLRRSARIPDYLPIHVHAVNGTNGAQIAGPYSGRIINISKHGACLLMTQVMRDNHHIFHSTREADSNILQLHIDLPPEINNVIINALPVWMDLYRKEEISAFMMGTEFLTSPEGQQMKRLRTALKKNQQQRGAWWTANARHRS